MTISNEFAQGVSFGAIATLVCLFILVTGWASERCGYRGATRGTGPIIPPKGGSGTAPPRLKRNHP